MEETSSIEIENDSQIERRMYDEEIKALKNSKLL